MRFPRVIVALLLALSFISGSGCLDAAKGAKGSGQSSTQSTPRPKTTSAQTPLAETQQSADRGNAEAQRLAREWQAAFEKRQLK